MSTPDTTPTPPEVFFADPSVLAEHPLLKGMPVVRRDEPETAGFIETIKTAGRIDVPILLDPEGRILDGRRRRLAASVLGLPLPARTVATGDAATVVLHSLAGRRNLTKGALAYLALPLLRPMIEEAQARRIAMLRRGDSPVTNSVGYGAKNLTQVAAELGFSDELLRQAAKVRELLEDDTVHEWGEDGAPATYRQHFEPVLFAGDIGLGGIIQAIAGKTATQGKARTTPAAREMFARDLEATKKRFAAKWEAIPPEERREITQEVAAAVTGWPEDVLRALLLRLKKMPNLKGDSNDPAF